jgi:hypothetical protein
VAIAAIAGSTASLRPSGIARYFGAAFLLVWLGGWALGEAFALGFLFFIVRSVVSSAAGVPWPIPGGEWIAGGAAGLVFLFLLIWLTLWTFGGVAAITELLRSLAGEDTVSVQMSGVELQRRAGPFRRTRTFDRAKIRRVRLRRHDQAVVMDTATGTEVVTKFGTHDERLAVTDWLRGRLLLPEASRVDPTAAPPGWVMTVDGGMARLSQLEETTRRTAALIAWSIALLLGLIWFGSGMTLSPGSLIALALALLAAYGAAWVTWSRREWRVRQGELTRHRRFLLWEWERSFRSAKLEVTLWTDSDNDDRFTLQVIDAQGKRDIASEINDAADLVDFARWLSARTGFRLALPRQLE